MCALLWKYMYVHVVGMVHVNQLISTFHKNILAGSHTILAEGTNLFESSCVSLLHSATLEGPLVNYQELPCVDIHGNTYRIPTSWTFTYMSHAHMHRYWVKWTRTRLYTLQVGIFTRRKFSPILPPALIGEIISTKNFCNTKVAGPCETFIWQKFPRTCIRYTTLYYAHVQNHLNTSFLPRYFPLCSLTPLLALRLVLSPPSLFTATLPQPCCKWPPVDALTPCIGEWVEEGGVPVGGVS